MPVLTATPVRHGTHGPAVPVSPGAVTPSSRTCTSYEAIPERASVPDQATGKLAEVCAAVKSVTSEDGAVVSITIVSDTFVDTLPSRSRNWAYTVLVPS